MDIERILRELSELQQVASHERGRLAAMREKLITEFGVPHRSITIELASNGSVSSAHITPASGQGIPPERINSELQAAVLHARRTLITQDFERALALPRGERATPTQKEEAMMSETTDPLGKVHVTWAGQQVIRIYADESWAASASPSAIERAIVMAGSEPAPSARKAGQ